MVVEVWNWVVESAVFAKLRNGYIANIRFR